MAACCSGKISLHTAAVGWGIQWQRCEAKFEAWHRYGTQSTLALQ